MTQEKRLMVNLICLHQAYKRHKITKVKWIRGGDNPADAMIKAKPYQALKILIDINKLNLKVTEWVERD
jgi:hypothetical protein